MNLLIETLNILGLTIILTMVFVLGGLVLCAASAIIVNMIFCIAKYISGR